MADRKNLWRPRFSLRTLAIVVTLSAAILGWFTQTALRQRRAVTELTKFGADVLYEHRSDPQAISLCPNWLRDWLGVDFFAEATEVRFGLDLEWGSGGYLRGKKSVVLSDASLARRNSLSGRVALPAPTPKTIAEDAVRQLCNLRYLEKVTIDAFTTNQAKALVASNPRFVTFRYSGFELDPQTLQRLRDHPALRELDLSRMPADDEVLAGLNGFHGVQRLSLGEMKFSAQGARHLATLTNLQELKFTKNGNRGIFSLNGSRTAVDPPSLDDIPALPDLRQLSLPDIAITNQSAHNLAKFPRLEILHLQSIEVDDEGIRHFTHVTHLQELNLIDSRITDAGAEHLGKLTGLRKLVLTNNRITDDGLRHLATLTNLESLYLPHLPITNAGLGPLRGATAMKVLVLSGTKITDAGLDHLAGMSELARLDLSFTDISDESIDRLLDFKKLSSLRLLGTHITRPEAIRLRFAIPGTSMPDAIDPLPAK